MKPRILRGFRNSVSVERGPVVFSYPIGESWLKLRDRGMTADWQVFPKTQWNYALATPDETTLRIQEQPMRPGPFSLGGVPVTVQVKARKLTSWRSEDGAAANVPQSPVTTSEPLETITLVPYAAAKLRITAFPQLKPDHEA